MEVDFLSSREVLFERARASQVAENAWILDKFLGSVPPRAKARIDSADFMRGLNPPPPFESSSSAARSA